jgi:hypothetical protein
MTNKSAPQAPRKRPAGPGLPPVAGTNRVDLPFRLVVTY